MKYHNDTSISPGCGRDLLVVAAVVVLVAAEIKSYLNLSTVCNSKTFQQLNLESNTHQLWSLWLLLVPEHSRPHFVSCTPMCSYRNTVQRCSAFQLMFRYCIEWIDRKCRAPESWSDHVANSCHNWRIEDSHKCHSLRTSNRRDNREGMPLHSCTRSMNCNRVGAEWSSHSAHFHKLGNRQQWFACNRQPQSNRKLFRTLLNSFQLIRNSARITKNRWK